MKYEERLTQWVGDGASLILDNPRNVEEAKAQLQDKFKLACIKLAEFEDKIEDGTLMEVPKEVVVYTPNVVLTPEEREEEMRLCNEERKQAVREFAEKLRDKEFAAKIGSEWFAVVKSLDIDELVEEVCGE